MKGIIKSIIEFVVGIALLPTAGAFVTHVNNDPNLSGIMGLSLVISLGLVIIGFGLIYNSVKTFFSGS